MSKETSFHPEPGRLLEFAGGELGEEARGEVLAHVRDCEACRQWLDDLASGVAEYGREWSAWKEAAEPPPQPWVDLRDRLAASRREAAQRRQAWRWYGVAAAALIAAVVVYRSSEQTVSAAELLRDAARREAPAESRRPPIRVTTRRGSMVRPAIVRPALLRGEPMPAADSLRSRFEAANYSWEDPLSARSFSAWRTALPDAQDAVVKLRGQDGTRSYEITTRTESGTLAEASLRFRESDLRAIQGSLRFRDQELVEIVEVPGAVPDLAPLPPVASAPGAAPQPAAVPLIEPVTAGEELRVWAALRRIDADLGEPIEVEREPNSIVVTALGLSAARQRALEQAMSGLPRVQLRFREPQPVREPARRVPDRPAAVAARPAIEAQLGRPIPEEFVDQTLAASESSLLRAHAMRELALRYPAEVEGRLSSSDRAVLSALVADHFEGFQTTARRVLEHARQLVPATVAGQAGPARSWQDHAQSLVAAVEPVDQALTKLLAGSGTPDLAALNAELDAALRRLESELRRPR